MSDLFLLSEIAAPTKIKEQQVEFNEKEVGEVIGFTEWKESRKQRQKEKEAFQPYKKMYSTFNQLMFKKEFKEMREFLSQQVVKEEIAPEHKYTMLVVLASHYIDLGAYETAAQLYDESFIWCMKDERAYNEGVDFVMERIYECERPDLLQKWFAHYESQMDEEMKRSWREKISLRS